MFIYETIATRHTALPLNCTRRFTKIIRIKTMSYWDEKHSEDEDPFRKNCTEVAHRISTKGALRIMCCIDGSNQADAAFHSALNMRRKFDHVEVFHAYKGNLVIKILLVVNFLKLSFRCCLCLYHPDIPDLQPATWRYNQLRSKYETELIGHIPTSMYSMMWIDRKGIDVNTMLHSCVDPEHFGSNARDPSPLTYPPDLIIMGKHGRKGPKEQKFAIGSTADQALR